MLKISKLALTFGVMSLALVSCSEREVVPANDSSSQELATLTKPFSNEETLKSKSLVANTTQMANPSASIGNGWAYGLPLQTGVNFRLINVSYVSSIEKSLRVVKNWFPDPRINLETIYNVSLTNSTQSEVGVSASAGISASAMNGLISSNVSVDASKTVSASIQQSVNQAVTVPKMKQARISLFERRKGYVATLVRINVIGNPVTASVAKGTINVTNYSVTGSVPVYSYVNVEYR